MAPFSIEILLAVYNDPKATALTLDGYLRQTDTDFSIAIADDGSTDEIRQLIDAYRPHLNIRHLWHPDEGFRKTIILNQAIASSQADYLIFTDNDCIPSRHFVADHRLFAEPGCFVTGRRVDLGPLPTQELLSGRQKDPERMRWLIPHALHRGLKRFEKALRPPLFAARYWSRKPIGTLGANMAFWRDDLLRVNGFDEEYLGYGQEEVDLEWRVIASGVRRKSILGRGALFHLYHEHRTMTDRNAELLAERKRQGKWRVANGIAKDTTQ